MKLLLVLPDALLQVGRYDDVEALALPREDLDVGVLEHVALGNVLVVRNTEIPRRWLRMTASGAVVAQDDGGGEMWLRMAAEKSWD